MRCWARRRSRRPVRVAGAMVTRATSEPPSQRPSTICQIGVGESHVKWNVPARTSAPITASPMTSAAIGITSEKIPSAATLANARSAWGVVDRVGEQSEEQRTRARQQHRGPSFRRDARLQRVDEDGDEPRSRAPVAATLVRRRSVIAPAPGRGSRASRRGREPRGGVPMLRARGAAAPSPGRALARSGSRARRASCRS